MKFSAVVLAFVLSLQFVPHSVFGKFTLLPQWKPYYKVLSGTSDLSQLTFNETLAATNTTLWQPMVHVVLNHSFNEQGWDFVHVAPVAEIAGSSDSFYLTGYAEGFLTADQIRIAIDAATQPTEAARQWMESHISYMKGKITVATASDYAKHANTSTVAGKLMKFEKKFWTRVKGIFHQMEGLVAGFNAAGGSTAIKFFDIFNLNFQDELGDVEVKVAPTSPEKPVHFSKRGGRHCSALIRVTKEELFMAHDTWSSFQSMQRRQYKTYQMDTTIAFSGYPGMVSSGDDWYVTSGKMAMQETTNLVWNTTLTKLYVLPDTTSEFIRVMVANYLTSHSDGGSKWVEYFQFNNSGTYNNQWMVVNMNSFWKNKPSVPDGTLWVAEQIPGNVTSRDVTDVLKSQGYWASYNIPYFDNIYKVSGYGEALEREGSIWSYNDYARAKIFRLRAPMVESLQDMKDIMRYNDFKVDPFSRIPNCSTATNGVCNPKQSAMLTIASRGDLNPWGEEAQYGQGYRWLNQRDHGATDSKIATANGLRDGVDGLRMSGIVICGPTHNRTYNIPPFRWSETNFSSLKPAQAPDLYEFEWQNYTLPYPPHGYYDGYTDVGVIAALLVAAFVLGIVVVGIVVKKKLSSTADDEYAERVGLTGKV